MGLVTSLLSPVFDGFFAVLMRPADFLQSPVKWLEAISKYRATHAGAPNFAYELCARRAPGNDRARLDLSHWRVAFNGAEPVREETLKRFAAAFAPFGFRPEAFLNCYGLAESTLAVSCSRPGARPRVCPSAAAPAELPEQGDEGDGAPARAVVSCGPPAAGQAVAIVDPLSRRRLRDGEEGEIWVSGPSVGLGYWNRPAETQRTFRARLEGDDRAYLRTGDLGFMLERELYVTGRLKDLLIIAGRNVHPGDLECTLEASHDAVRPHGSAAFSHNVDGQERLIVVAEVERRYVRNRAEYREILTALRKALASGHDIRAYLIALVPPGSMPKTSSGKVRRHQCRAQLLDGTLPVLNLDRADIPASPQRPITDDAGFVATSR
jgi:acyl-CoA synthetase (AMP-forming)/AMP-acid ligase II